MRQGIFSITHAFRPKPRQDITASRGRGFQRLTKSISEKRIKFLALSGILSLPAVSGIKIKNKSPCLIEGTTNTFAGQGLFPYLNLNPNLNLNLNLKMPAHIIILYL